MDTKIDKNIEIFLKGRNKNNGRSPNERYASFDYCYNYFYSFYFDNNIKKIASKENLKCSCLHLGFYLASWGMLRGSSFLLEKSARNFIPLIKSISRMDRNLWEIDIDIYTSENIEIIFKCKEEIIKALGKENNPSDTLITKIMLGVFANVPAYDQYFRKTFKKDYRLYSFNEKSLLNLNEFYNKNKKSFNKKIKTLDFLSGNYTDIRYTKAKLIDMYGFIAGQDLNKK